MITRSNSNYYIPTKFSVEFVLTWSCTENRAYEVNVLLLFAGHRQTCKIQFPGMVTVKNNYNSVELYLHVVRRWLGNRRRKFTSNFFISQYINFKLHKTILWYKYLCGNKTIHRMPRVQSILTTLFPFPVDFVDTFASNCWNILHLRKLLNWTINFCHILPNSLHFWKW